MTSPLTESEYDAAAAPELQLLIAALDELESDAIEAELSSDILTIEYADGTRYVVNSHRAARQIWLAAERSAWHFDWHPTTKQWLASKTGDELWTTLSRLVSGKLGQAVELRRA